MDGKTERLRLATFNLENLGDVPSEEPSLETRISLMRPQLLRLDADVLCLQERSTARATPPPGRSRR